MKDIKNILLVLLTLFLFSCENEDSKKFDAENQSFVRFFLLVDSNNNVLEFPEKDGGLLAKKAYNKDNLKILKIPTIELHISNIYNREEFRHKSLISKVAKGIICGFGANGYIMALKAMNTYLKK